MNIKKYSDRHIGPTESGISEMLNSLNVDSVEQLIQEIIPKDIMLDEKDFNIVDEISEYDFLKKIHALGKLNKQNDCYIGLGYHPTISPSVIIRNILENPGWYTAYTPYQAEISQGRLEALLNYQTMVCDLTGMELANASLLDESTAAAEAMLFLYNIQVPKHKDKTTKFFVADDILPQTWDVLKTKASNYNIQLEKGSIESFNYSEDYFGAILQSPGKFGNLIDFKSFIEKANTNGIKVAVAADIMSLLLIEAPGKLGADVVVGTSQRFGIPLGYGGPHAAFFACKDEYKRYIPGRIIGLTKDTDGNSALRMALQTREQHIKRDRATSNICTAQVLLAVMAGMYAVYHGPNGLFAIANKIHKSAVTLDEKLKELGITQLNENYFDTLLVNIEVDKIRPLALKNNINLLYVAEDKVAISINETTTINDINRLIELFSTCIDRNFTPINLLENKSKIPQSLQRKTTYLQNPIFNKYHSETSLMRYIKKLERKDISLNHSMIALGSCTMKLNAASLMLPLSNSQWNNIHPFVPVEQANGYSKVLEDLCQFLSKITGFAGTTLQPNSGAQGEYTGLLIIKAYLKSKNQLHRNICLIPSSAHGTNPASAIIAGMKVVVVKTDAQGNIDIEDLKSKAIEHKENLAALMITYPSTHGIFENNIQKITAIIHENGGQVYMDGANMNAQVGLTNPAIIGADVCHLNLHKTFAIPHGGGGPGVGPVCVAAHLKDFLPSHFMFSENKDIVVSSAPWGSALVSLISYGYIRLLGTNGLKKSTSVAILNANYIKKRIEKYFNILYVGNNNRVAHELIIDCRTFKEKNIDVIDIAKRLMDYGYHAPTVSFPVPNTMMIEPTESENKEEIDTFCDALINIYHEIQNINDTENNLLKNAPHTLNMIASDNWAYPYTRNEAAFPLDYIKENKVWATVRRVNEAFGDRNLICTCPDISEYES